MARPKKLRPPKAHERAWGEGTVREVRPNVWRAWRARVRDGSGASTRASRTFDGPTAEQSARLWARGAVQPAVLLLGLWLDRWLALTSPLVLPNTRRNYERYVDLCLPLAARPLAELTVEDWQRLTNDLLARYARSTVQVWRSTISAALKAAVPRFLPFNPMSSVRLPRAEERPVRAWRRDEVLQLVAAASGKAHETWLWVALCTGIRLGEARALLWTDIDFDDRVATISKSLDHYTDAVGPTKSKRTRIVDLPEELLPVLRAHRARQRPGTLNVCTSRYNGQVPRPSAVEMWIERLAEGIGVTPLPPHSARHTFATLSLENNVPLKEVSESLGHASIAITASIYSHVVERHRRRAANTMGAVLSGQIPTPIRPNGTRIGTREAV